MQHGHPQPRVNVVDDGEGEADRPFFILVGITVPCAGAWPDHQCVRAGYVDLSRVPAPKVETCGCTRRLITYVSLLKKQD